MCLIASQVAGVAPISPKKTRTGGAHHLFDESPDRSLAEYRANRESRPKSSRGTREPVLRDPDPPDTRPNPSIDPVRTQKLQSCCMTPEVCNITN